MQQCDATSYCISRVAHVNAFPEGFDTPMVTLAIDVQRQRILPLDVSWNVPQLSGTAWTTLYVTSVGNVLTGILSYLSNTSPPGRQFSYRIETPLSNQIESPFAHERSRIRPLSVPRVDSGQVRSSGCPRTCNPHDDLPCRHRSL